MLSLSYFYPIYRSDEGISDLQRAPVLRSLLASPTSLLKGDIDDHALAAITISAAKISLQVEAKRDSVKVKRVLIYESDPHRISTTGEQAYICVCLSWTYCVIADHVSYRLCQVVMTFAALALVKIRSQTTATSHELV